MKAFRPSNTFTVLILVNFLLAGVFEVPAAEALLPGLSVNGANIMANGQPVQLRGVNMTDLFEARNYLNWYPNSDYSIANYATLADVWHAKIVRISIFPSQWYNYSNAIEPYFSVLLPKLEGEVNAALDKGMYVIISYHVIGWPNGWYEAGNLPGEHDTYDSDLELAKGFWAKMASIYGGETSIIFDLWNEPAYGDPNQKGVHNASDDCHADHLPNRWPELRTFYNDHLIKTVRDNGAQNIVLVTGNCWASWLADIAGDPLDDNLNVAYAYHKYADEGNNNTEKWDADTAGLIEVKPVIVSEWGYSDDDAVSRLWPGTWDTPATPLLTYGKPFTDWMDSHKLSNLAWSYHHDMPPALLFENGTLTKYGVAAKNYISAVAVTTTNKVLTQDRAIATWLAGIPAGERRPVVVFLPGWGGVGNVNAFVSGQNMNLVNEGYVTLAIGFDSNVEWISNLDWRTKDGLDKLCADATIPANCNAIVLDGGSYGGIQNDLVIRNLRGNGYDGGAGSTGKALGFVSEDAGYVPPGNWPPGPRTGLADTASYSVAMIENLGDMTFPVDSCDEYGNCGARILGTAHLARGDNNVFSICPSGGSHGDHSGFAGWNAWVISAIKTMIHVNGGIATFAGYTNPTLAVSNTCTLDISAPVLAQVTPVPVQASNQNPLYTFSSTEAGAISYGGSCSSASTAAATGDNIITLTSVSGGPLENGTYNDCTITVMDAAGNPSTALAIDPFTVDTASWFLWVWNWNTSTEYATLKAAYDAAQNNHVLRARAAILPEALTFNGNRNIILRGGYDSIYEANAGGFTTIRSLTIGGPGTENGGVTIENVKIR